jgi:hypothetical protein
MGRFTSLLSMQRHDTYSVIFGARVARLLRETEDGICQFIGKALSVPMVMGGLSYMWSGELRSDRIALVSTLHSLVLWHWCLIWSGQSYIDKYQAQ